MVGEDKKKKREIANFIYLFSICVVGAAAIFIFAVGIETGSPMANEILSLLLQNILLLIGLCLVCMWLLWKVFSRRNNT